MSGFEFQLTSQRTNLYEEFKKKEEEPKKKKKPKKKEVVSKSFNEIVEQSTKPKKVEKEETKEEPTFETGKTRGSTFSEMKIETLNLNPVLESHLKSIGYTNLTKIQQISYKPIKTGKDM